MKALVIVIEREFASYFATPLAYVFLLAFLVLAPLFTFYLGGFYHNEQADLQVFFSFHPWLYLFLLPALGMRLWAEERKSGTIELLMTLPLPTASLIGGKFLAAWLFAGLALGLTFPMVLTVNFLGSPDNGAILTGYLGSWLLAGAFLALCSCVSAAAKNPVIAFIAAVLLCLVFVASGHALVLDSFSAWSSSWWLDTVASLSFLTRFHALSQGVIELRDLVFFLSFIMAWLLATAIMLNLKKAN